MHKYTRKLETIRNIRSPPIIVGLLMPRDNEAAIGLDGKNAA